MAFEDVPRRKKIIDFFPEEKEEPQKKRRGAAKKADEKKKRHRISTYLTDKQYKQFIAYCEEQDVSPAEAVRIAIRNAICRANK